jgi:hypothetical protein
MSRAGREGVPYLFKPRATRNVKRLIEKAMEVFAAVVGLTA